jgi:hypothetical protein
MWTARKKHFNALALIVAVFEHVPKDWRVGLLYDIACQLHHDGVMRLIGWTVWNLVFPSCMLTAINGPVNFGIALTSQVFGGYLVVVKDSGVSSGN